MGVPEEVLGAESLVPNLDETCPPHFIFKLSKGGVRSLMRKSEVRRQKGHWRENSKYEVKNASSQWHKPMTRSNLKVT